MRSPGRLTSIEEFGEIVIRANPDGSLLRLKEVARIELGAQTYNLAGRLDGKPSAILALYQLPGTNALDAANGVKALMKRVAQQFPPDMTYAIPLDTTLAVTAGMHEIIFTLLEALLLVILVVFVFLQGWRATLIPLCAVPVSLIGTFMVFPLFGFTINTLALFGLVLAIGLVVALAGAIGFIFVQRRGLSFVEPIARNLTKRWLVDVAAYTRSVKHEIDATYRYRPGLKRGLSLHLLAWIGNGGEAWVALHFMGVPLSLAAVLAIESLLYAIRSLAFLVPNAAGVQEGAYVMLGGLFGLPPDTALALSLLKRARDLAIGIPALATWQVLESGKLWRRRLKPE